MIAQVVVCITGSLSYIAVETLCLLPLLWLLKSVSVEDIWLPIHAVIRLHDVCAW